MHVRVWPKHSYLQTYPTEVKCVRAVDATSQIMDGARVAVAALMMHIIIILSSPVSTIFYLIEIIFQWILIKPGGT